MPDGLVAASLSPCQNVCTTRQTGLAHPDLLCHASEASRLRLQPKALRPDEDSWQILCLMPYAFRSWPRPLLMQSSALGQLNIRHSQGMKFRSPACSVNQESFMPTCHRVAEQTVSRFMPRPKPSRSLNAPLTKGTTSMIKNVFYAG